MTMNRRIANGALQNGRLREMEFDMRAVMEAYVQLLGFPTSVLKTDAQLRRSASARKGWVTRRAKKKVQP